jgi:hypothetical protein
MVERGIINVYSNVYLKKGLRIPKKRSTAHGKHLLNFIPGGGESSASVL